MDCDVLISLRDGLRAAERSLLAAPAAEGGLKLSFRRDGNTYWFLADPALRAFYLYVKGPSARHKAKYLGRRSLTEVVGRLGGRNTCDKRPLPPGEEAYRRRGEGGRRDAQKSRKGG